MYIKEKSIVIDKLNYIFESSEECMIYIEDLFTEESSKLTIKVSSPSLLNYLFFNKKMNIIFTLMIFYYYLEFQYSFKSFIIIKFIIIILRSWPVS